MAGLASEVPHHHDRDRGGSDNRRERRQLGVVVVTIGILLLAGDLLIAAVLGVRGEADISKSLPVIGQVSSLIGGPYLPQQVLVVGEGILALGTLAVGVGFWWWRRWAWVGVMVVASVLLTINLVAAAFDAADHLTMAVAVVVVFYLNQRDVQRRFGTQKERSPQPMMWINADGEVTWEAR